MRIKITGRNIELTEGLKAAVEDKLNKLEKYFTPDTDVYVTLSVEKERQKAEVTIPAKGNYIRSEQVSNDMYVSIDLVEEVIERQLKKYRTKLVTKFPFSSSASASSSVRTRPIIFSGSAKASSYGSITVWVRMVATGL